MPKEISFHYTDNFNSVKKNADNLHSSVKQLQKDADKLNETKAGDSIFVNAFKGIDKANRGIKELRQSQEGLNKSSNAYKGLEKEINSLLYQRRKIYQDIDTVIKLYEASEEKSNATEAKILKALTSKYKTQEKINNGIARSIQNRQRALEYDKQQTAEYKKQQQELNRVNQQAKEVGQLTKSILQDKNLNQKGSKNTRAQYDYQIESIKQLFAEIQKSDNAAEGLKHTLESMVYEVKHTTGKQLFKDTTDGINKLINLENKRAEAQKSGKQVMEQFYNEEIKKQKELINELKETANNPEKLKELLTKNMTSIKDLLTEDIGKKFEEQFNKTGIIDNAWAEGMKKYVLELEKAYNDQVKLNQAKSQQNAQDNSYKDLKVDLQEIWSIENKIAQLQKDPKKHSSEIQYYQQLLNNKRQELNYDNRINQLTDEQKKDIENLTREQKEYNGAVQAQSKDWKNNKKSVTELGDTIKKVFNYVIVYRFFYMLQQGINKALETMKELDKAFTDIQMVTGDTDEQTAQLAQDYNQLAKEMGSTTKEVAEGAAEWLRQGKNTEETTQLLKSSMTLSKVGAMESAEATELLTSTLNGYKFAAQDAMTVVDKISSIDLAAATSSYELATALSRTANSADDAGVSFDKLLAMIGTVSSVTRKSASTIRRIIQNNIRSYE